MNLLVEFEKRYKGDTSETWAICEAISDEFGINIDEVADYIYLNRYENVFEMYDMGYMDDEDDEDYLEDDNG